MATLTTGSFTATGDSASVVPVAAGAFKSGFNATIWGTFVGSIQLQRSFDQGITWVPITIGGAAALTYTAPASELVSEVESGVSWRCACTAYTSGTINYRLSQ
jgi:hypothetical protein